MLAASDNPTAAIASASQRSSSFIGMVQIVSKLNCRVTRRLPGLGACVTLLLAVAGLWHAAAGPATPSPNLSPPSKSTTFTTDVAPILFGNCVSCHRPGEAAPFSLMTYEDVRKRGRQIAEVTESKFMPPWHVEQGHVE